MIDSHPLGRQTRDVGEGRQEGKNDSNQNHERADRVPSLAPAELLYQRDFVAFVSNPQVKDGVHDLRPQNNISTIV